MSFGRGRMRQQQFGQRENGMATLGGEKVDYTAMYESPTLMQLTARRGRDGYEQIGTEEV